jgi:hypothetical protein
MESDAAPPLLKSNATSLPFHLLTPKCAEVAVQNSGKNPSPYPSGDGRLGAVGAVTAETSLRVRLGALVGVLV